MTLLQLQYFCALARNCHFTRTAEELHISQPTLSHAVKELEREVGGPLFRRRGGRVELTERARTLLPYVLSARQQLERGLEAARALEETASAPVRIAYVHSIADTLIPTLIQEFTAGEGRGVRFELEDAISEVSLRHLRGGRADLAFTTLRDEETASAPVLEQPLYLAVSREHPLAARSFVRFEDFRDEKMIAFLKPSNLREKTDRIFERRGARQRIAFEVRDSSVAFQYVALSFGAAILPESAAYDREHVKLLPISDEEGAFVRPVYLSWRRDAPLSAEAAAFRDFVLERRGGAGTAEG